MASDKDYMEGALELAKKGLGKTSPNPAVGSILVKNGKVIGRGFHEKAGEAHAEVNALAEAGDEAKGATMYVTLEPCDHRGKTPACTNAIIEAGVSRVVVGAQDPNSLVSGKGLAHLARAGIQIESGILEKQAKMMNEAYEKFITTKEPFVIVKAALSADGKMTASDGSSKWITGEDAKQAVQELRGQVDAIMVGIETVIKDNPSLTCRIQECKNPKRIIVDSRLRIKVSAKVLNNEARTIIATTKNAPMDKIDILRKLGVKVVVVEGEGGVDLKRLLKELVSEGITSIMIEGGGRLIGSAFDARIVDKVMLFIAPKIIGGKGVTISGEGAQSISDAIPLERVEMKKVGADFLLLGYPSK